LETITASTVDLKLAADKGAHASFSADQITKAFGLNAGVQYKQINSAELQIQTPILIGYKAWRISDSFVKYEVSASDLTDEKVLSTDEVAKLKQ
jgi:hypothetical protein